MAQRPLRSLVGRVRESPLGCLSALIWMSLQGVAMWLSFTNWTSPGIDENRTAVAEAVGMLAITFWVAMLWSMLFRSPLNSADAEDAAVTPNRSRVMRPSVRVRRAAFSMWMVVLVLALAQLAMALSGNLGVSLTLGMIVPGLSLIGVVGVAVAVVGRQR